MGGVQDSAKHADTVGTMRQPEGSKVRHVPCIDFAGHSYGSAFGTKSKHHPRAARCPGFFSLSISVTGLQPSRLCTTSDNRSKPLAPPLQKSQCLAIILTDDSRTSPQTADIGVANLPVEAQIAAGEVAASSQPLLHDKVEEKSGGGTDLVGRLKAAVLDCVDTAKRTPETFEEALAVIKGERAVKPDYGRAVSTVSAVR